MQLNHILPHSLATIYQAHDTEHNVILYASVSFSEFLIYDMPKCCNNMYIELLEEEEMHAEGSTTSRPLCTSDCSLMSDKYVIAPLVSTAASTAQQTPSISQWQIITTLMADRWWWISNGAGAGQFRYSHFLDMLCHFSPWSGCLWLLNP